MKIKTNLLQFHKRYKTVEIIIKYSVACIYSELNSNMNGLFDFNHTDLNILEESNILNIDPTCKSTIVLQGSYGTSTNEAATRNDQLCPLSD